MYNPEEVLDAIYWIAARSVAPEDYNRNIYSLLSEVQDIDYSLYDEM